MNKKTEKDTAPQKNDTKYTEFAEYFKNARKERNITSKDMAKILGVTTSAIGMYETAERRPSYEVLMRISNTFGKPMDELIGLCVKK